MGCVFVLFAVRWISTHRSVASVSFVLFFTVSFFWWRVSTIVTSACCSIFRVVDPFFLRGDNFADFLYLFEKISINTSVTEEAANAASMHASVIHDAMRFTTTFDTHTTMWPLLLDRVERQTNGWGTLLLVTRPHFAHYQFGCIRHVSPCCCRDFFPNPVTTIATVHRMPIPQTCAARAPKKYVCSVLSVLLVRDFVCCTVICILFCIFLSD